MIIGLVAAYARNALDDILMRAMDVIMAFPQIMLALVAVSLVGAKNWVIIVAIALTTAPRVARVARGAAQPVVERDFIGATEAMGMSRVRILSGELLPNILGPDDGGGDPPADLLDRGDLRPGLPGSGRQPGCSELGHDDPEEPGRAGLPAVRALLPIMAIALLTMGTGLIGDGIARTAAGIDRERGDE